MLPSHFLSIQRIAFVILFCSLLGACNSDNSRSVDANSPTITVTKAITPAETPGPTDVPLPGFLQENLEYFEEKGFTFEYVGGVWRIMDGDIQVMVLQGNEITMNIQEGGTVAFETDSYEKREVNGGNVKDIMTIKNDQGGVERFYLPDMGYWATPLARETSLNPSSWIHFDFDGDLLTGRLFYSLAIKAEDFPVDSVYYPLGRSGGEGGLSTLEFSIPVEEINSLKSDLEKAPFRFIGFYQTERQGYAYDVGALQVLNKDGSWGIVFLGFNSQPTRYLDFLVDTFTLQRIPTLLVGFRTSCDKTWDLYLGICRLIGTYSMELSDATRGTLEIGILSAEFETLLLGGIGGYW